MNFDGATLVLAFLQGEDQVCSRHQPLLELKMRESEFLKQTILLDVGLLFGQFLACEVKMLT